jgi:hypothetical protein
LIDTWPFTKLGDNGGFDTGGGAGGVYSNQIVLPVESDIITISIDNNSYWSVISTLIDTWSISKLISKAMYLCIFY